MALTQQTLVEGGNRHRELSRPPLEQPGPCQYESF
jgi:hypothetical protein